VCVCGAGNVKVTLADKENPSEVICQRQEITGIGDLKDVLSLRKINMSFNPISTLKGIDQLKELRHLSAYCCRLTNVDDLSGYVA
jgi:pantothenate kinase